MHLAWRERMLCCMEQELSHLTFSEDDPMEATLHRMAVAHSKRLTVPRSKAFTRKQVIDAFQNAFDLIGGVPRLAAWAHENPTDFYRLYSKLLGSHVEVDVGDGVLKIVHALAPGPLDTIPSKKVGEVVDGEFETKAE